MMEKVVVPKYVAEFIEVKKEIKSLEGIVKDYDFFSKTLGNLTSGHLSAIEWYVENPYEFIRAWVEGYEVEEKKEYVWRKKKEHLASFEKNQYLRIIESSTRGFTGDTTDVLEPYARYSESTLIRYLGVDDFNLFEKVED